MSQPPPNVPASEPDPEPMVFFAFASKSLIRGEMIEFHVDRQGRITSSKLDFDSAAPRLQRVPATG